jgi:hypothetical protein
MFLFRLLSHSFRHPVQFAARAFDLASDLLLLRAVHLRQDRRQPPAGAPQNGHRHLQIALHLFHRRGLTGRRLPLRLQKQLRLGQNALARGARTLAPGGI